ncbi:MAG: hypothetical protein ACLPY2_04845 [Bryobacteraceae bacterium]|jgi:hypothetical protein
MCTKEISIGDGEGLDGSLAAAARRNSRNSWPVRMGKPSVDWAMISVWTQSARWKRIAKPRGFALGSLSGNIGSPVESAKAEEPQRWRLPSLGLDGEWSTNARAPRTALPAIHPWRLFS